MAYRTKQEVTSYNVFCLLEQQTQKVMWPKKVVIVIY